MPWRRYHRRPLARTSTRGKTFNSSICRRINVATYLSANSTREAGGENCVRCTTHASIEAGLWYNGPGHLIRFASAECPADWYPGWCQVTVSENVSGAENLVFRNPDAIHIPHSRASEHLMWERREIEWTPGGPAVASQRGLGQATAP